MLGMSVTLVDCGETIVEVFVSVLIILVFSQQSFTLMFLTLFSVTVNDLIMLISK